MTHFYQTHEMSWVASERKSGKEPESDPWDEREATCSRRWLGSLTRSSGSFPSQTRITTGLGVHVLSPPDLKSKPNAHESLHRQEKQD
jgi:hypothetical protein